MRLSFLLSFLLISLISASSIIQEWTDSHLQKVDETGPEVHRLYLFYAEWCGACRRYKPKFQQVAPKLAQLSPINLEIIQINLDKGPKLGSRFRVSHLPTLYHQIGDEFRKLDAFQGNLEKYFMDKIWIGTPTMGPLSPPRGGNDSIGGSSKSKKFTLTKFVEDLGISFPVFVLISFTLLMFISLFIVWCIWLYTDYKLNSHNFTEEAIKERIKILKTLPEFEGEFDNSESEFEKEDSGEESDTESEQSTSELVPLRGRRSSLKNRLK